jgi:ketosteroid isomerase-like protein
VPGSLHRFYALLDGGDTARTLDMLAEDLQVSILFSDPRTGAREFAGGRDEYDAYMAQRGTPSWTHHVLAELVDGDVEIVLGETRQNGAQLASFVAAAELDADGRISRYLVGRSPAVLFGLRRKSA